MGYKPERIFRNKNLVLEIILLFIGFAYYLFFSNKGIDLFDEGYFVHAAERIFNGQIPYRDFALQYTPGHFYLLAALYRIFGPSIIVGRLLSLSYCLLIILISFLILNKLKIKSSGIIILSFLGFASFGYPLLNLPIPVWASVLVSLLLVLTYIYWIDQRKTYLHLIVMGFLLSLGLAVRQNLGLAYILVMNFLVFFGNKNKVNEKFKNLLFLNSCFLIFSLIWVYPLFMGGNMEGLVRFMSFSKKFSSQFVFSYPPPSYILRPDGLLKLLPYYLPIIFLLLIIKYLFSKQKEWGLIALCLVPLAGFFTYVYPNSELLHVYPFWGPMIFSMIIYFVFKKKSRVWFFIILIMIGIGFYLTLFREYYRYHPPYRFQNTPIGLPRSKEILADKIMSESLVSLSGFINHHTKKTDYIFSYPYYPMLYFLLQRPNPSKDLLYFPDLWHAFDDNTIISEIKSKKPKYAIISYGFTSDYSLYQLITEQKKVFNNKIFDVYEFK